MSKTEAIQEIRKLKPNFKKSLIEIESITKPYYNNGGYYIDVVRFIYKGIKYQLNVDLIENVMFTI